MKEGLLKKRIILTISTIRMTLLLSLIILEYYGGIVSNERLQLFGMLLPLSFLYFALSLKFIIRNRYLTAGQTVSKTYFMLGYPLIAVLYLLEIVLLFCKGFFNLIDIQTLYYAYFLLEGILGVHAGLYLSDLFAQTSGETPVETDKI